MGEMVSLIVHCYGTRPELPRKQPRGPKSLVRIQKIFQPNQAPESFLGAIRHVNRRFPLPVFKHPALAGREISAEEGLEGRHQRLNVGFERVIPR